MPQIHSKVLTDNHINKRRHIGSKIQQEADKKKLQEYFLECPKTQCQIAAQIYTVRDDR